MTTYSRCPSCRNTVSGYASVCGHCRQALGWFKGTAYSAEEADHLEYKEELLRSSMWSNWPWAWHLGLTAVLAGYFWAQKSPIEIGDFVALAFVSLVWSTLVMWPIAWAVARLRVGHSIRSQLQQRDADYREAQDQARQLIAHRSRGEPGPFETDYRKVLGDRDPDTIMLDDLVEAVFESYGADTLRILEYEGHWSLVEDDVIAVVGSARSYAVIRELQMELS